MMEEMHECRQRLIKETVERGDGDYYYYYYYSRVMVVTSAP